MGLSERRAACGNMATTQVFIERVSQDVLVCRRMSRSVVPVCPRPRSVSARLLKGVGLFFQWSSSCSRSWKGAEALTRFLLVSFFNVANFLRARVDYLYPPKPPHLALPTFWRRGQSSHSHPWQPGEHSVRCPQLDCWTGSCTLGISESVHALPAPLLPSQSNTG